MQESLVRAAASPMPTGQRVARAVLLTLGWASCLFLGWLTGIPGLTVALVLLVIATGWTIASQPKAYRIDPHRRLVVERRLGQRTFAGAHRVERFTNIQGLRRRAQPSGLTLAGVGSWGSQQTLSGDPAAPGYRVHVAYTDEGSLVRVEVRGGTVLISPTEPSEFAQQARLKLGVQDR